ncbi:uncharacterized protein TRIADDRAFT_60087 [Trichoplax adhaerens]|uniref:G-protein coupled receptors family 2 profile 2 domain-containing protein n=1 Tax=Trichoplax adhaerens TaxID=10228 RepID=B3S796_TRIAD|nr:hypothetical protein TRIADDRAFT_60087 [Trichoplax adhaerens]EDV21447.1 hypothetical protein TRIADDRAFT_60087 [Trichoplax adhaerens]|eukprot:XP_002116047.1 hypothetical protein TRIADDRAFT_60087 [Trichoplax adhaerens]
MATNEFLIVPSAAPVDVRISPTANGATSAIVAWSIPTLFNQNGIITGYHIKYFPLDQLQNETVISLGNITQYTLLNLNPKRNYSIQVAAATSIGIGPYSAATIYETHEAVAPNVTQSPRSSVVKAGTVIRLECAATGDPTPTTKWIKDNQPISTVYNVLTNPGYGRLIVTDIGTADNGSYWCQFTNIKATIVTDAAIIAVEDSNTTGFCIDEIVNNMRWPKTYGGQTAIVSCPSPIQGNATRLCTAGINRASTWEQIDTTGCQSPAFAAATSLINKLDSIGQGAANETLTELETLSANKTLYGGDIIKAIEILTKINRVSTWVDAPLLTNYVNVHSNLLNSDNKNAWKYASKFCLDINGNTVSVMDNLEEFASKMNDTSNNKTITILSNNIVQKQVIVIYKTLGNLIPANLHRDRNATSTGVNSVNSHIISTSMYPNAAKNLSHPLQITFVNKNAINSNNNYVEISCTFWQSKSGLCGWSTSGCWKDLKSNSTHTICYCNHTTTFGTILTHLPQDKIKLEVIIYIGCGLASFLLALTIAINIIYWRRTPKILGIINVSMFICILIANIIVIFGLIETESKLRCTIVATILHYVLLAAFAWMLCHSFYLFSSLTSKDGNGKYCKSFIFAAFILALAIAIVTAAVAINGMGMQNYIQNNSSFLPAALILMLLLVIDWTLFVLFVAIGNVVLQYLFAVINFLQALYIFAFYGLKQIMCGNIDQVGNHALNNLNMCYNYIYLKVVGMSNHK